MISHVYLFGSETLSPWKSANEFFFPQTISFPLSLSGKLHIFLLFFKNLFFFVFRF